MYTVFRNKDVKHCVMYRIGIMLCCWRLFLLYFFGSPLAFKQLITQSL